MDEHLRDLERRFRATGSADDGATWLSARLRANGLSSDRLELAALCGDEAARRVRPRPGVERLLTQEALADALGRMGMSFHGPALVRRWIADGLPARDGAYDPVDVLAWLDERKLPQLERLTIVFVHVRDAVAALRLVWAMMKARARGPRSHRISGPFAAAFEACLDDPTIDARRRTASGLAAGLGHAAPLLCRAVEEIPDLAATLASFAALGRRLKGGHFAAARAELAAWALGDAPPPSWSMPYVVRSSEIYTARDWYDDAQDAICGTRYQVVDRRTERVLHSFSQLEGSGPRRVDLSPDGRTVLVQHDDVRVERIDLPP